jgi:hypothetical protein
MKKKKPSFRKGGSILAKKSMVIAVISFNHELFRRYIMIFQVMGLAKVIGMAR